ncbi:hypothetical protein THAOC_27896 [Thalassiosira oceanica]|uniref:Uncharacterized protein n=1 Tax=Thalassiosira oceanica TaxID=159749 RepID=K0RHT0_THAOC|nr:hypothetical protein THAOC_27896 [Thalassiosira oceanica]|eukprot:EJK52795.1 hypothetical protein THAOC_27896 [Thalassiosira oceanica]
MGSSQSRNGILEEPFHLLRRDGRTQTQASTLVTNPVGRARMGSEEGRWTGGWLYRVLREGDFRHGRARLVSRRTGKARFGAPARVSAVSAVDEYDNTRRLVVLPWSVASRRLIRGEAGECVARAGIWAASRGRRPWRGASARNMKPPAKEDDYVKRWKGWLFLRRRSGRPNGRRSAPCFLRAVYKKEKALACCQGSSLMDLGRGALRTHTTRHGQRGRRGSRGGGEKAPRLVPGRRRQRGEAVEGPRRQERALRLLRGGGGGRSRTPAVGLGGDLEEGSRKKGRRHRGGSDSGDDVRRPERRRHDSSDEDDDGSDSVDAAGRAKRMSSSHRSGLQNASDFASAERKFRKRQRRELEKAQREERRGRPYGLPGQVWEEEGGRPRRGRGGVGADREGVGGEAVRYLEAQKKAETDDSMAAQEEAGGGIRLEGRRAGSTHGEETRRQRRESMDDPYDIFESQRKSALYSLESVLNRSPPI